MCIAHLKEIRDKMKSLKCVRKPHLHTATHVFSKLSFLPIMVVYSLYFTVLRDRIMLYHQEKSHVCASARSRLREDLIRLFLVLISGIPHWQKRCASPLSLCVKISDQQVLALGTRSDNVQASLLEIMLWRNLLWKAEVGPAAFVLNSFMLSWVLWCVKSSSCGLVHAK